MATGVPWQAILKNLMSCSCRTRRIGVEQALDYLDTLLLGGDAKLVAEQISNCVSVLVAFANSSFGCEGFDPKNRPADKAVLFRQQTWHFMRWKDGHSRHTCRWQPTCRAVQGLIERIVEPAFFSQPESLMHTFMMWPGVQTCISCHKGDMIRQRQCLVMSPWPFLACRAWCLTVR